MTAKQMLSILAARWWLVLAVVLSLVAGTMLYSMLMLKRYTATATLMFDARSPEQVAGGTPNASLPSGWLATQMDLIGSERVARAVIGAIGLSSDRELRQQWRSMSDGHGNFEAWLADALLKGLNVKGSPVSNVVTVSYSADDPLRSATITNAFVKAYNDAALDIRMERVRQYTAFFDERAKEFRANVEAAQSRLAEYQQDNNLVPGSEKLEKIDVETARLAELVAQAVRLQNLATQAAARPPVPREPAGDEAPRTAAATALATEITNEEVRLREMTERLGASHPVLQSQEARLAELKDQLAKERARAADAAGASIAANRARLRRVTAALEAQREKVMTMQMQREHAATLQREVENAQRTYDTMLQRGTQASIELHNTFANVAVLKTATAPMSPSSPNVPKFLAVSLVAGLMLGIGLAVGVEMLDRRVRNADDLAEMHQVALLSLPLARYDKRNVPDTSRVKQIKQRVMTGLPMPSPQRS